MLSENIMDFIRQIEKNTLDQEYKKYNIIYRPSDLAIMYLLKVFGDALRDIENDPQLKFSNFQAFYFVNHCVGGLSHCLRWLSQTVELSFQIKVSNVQLEKEARELLWWAMDYDTLCREHIAWSRGLNDVDIDRTSKYIKFYPKESSGAFFCFTQLVSEIDFGNYNAKLRSSSDLKTNFIHWFKEAKFDYNDISIPWEYPKRSPIYKTVMSWFSKTVFPELPATTDLGGYTLTDFRDCFTALFINCLYYTWVENNFDKLHGLDNWLGSAAISMPKTEMAEWLSEISNVNLSSANCILNDLIFDTSNFHNNFVIQPFVNSKTDTIYTLPRIIANADPRRMLAYALNKGKKRGYYDKNINLIEKNNLQLIRDAFSSLGFEVLEQKVFFSPDGSKYNPDILIVSKRDKEILVIDYKHFLTPIGTSEVIYKMDEVEKGIDQVNKYINFIKNDKPLQTKLILDESEPKVFGLLLFHWPVPVPVKYQENVCIIDWINLNHVLKEKKFDTLSKFINWITERPDLQTNPQKFSWVPREIKVSDWTYTTMIYVEKNPEIPEVKVMK
jgi:hypothetical protein